MGAFGRDRARGRARGGGVPAAYSLAALAAQYGAVFAVDAGHYHADGALADVLLDQSGHGLDATQLTDAAEMTPVAADANLNGRPSLTTDNARFYETAASADVSSAYTAVAVVRPSALKSWHGFFRLGLAGLTGAGGVDGFAVFAASDGKLWWSSPDASSWTWTSTGALVAANTAYVVTAKTTSAGGAARHLRLNGTEVTGSGAFAGTYAHPTAGKVVAPGAGFTNSSSRLAGSLAAQLLCPTALTDADCLALERALGAYYGITVA